MSATHRTEHDQEHEDVIRALIAGDLEPQQPRARDLIESCAECRRQLAGLEHVRDLLDEVAREERDTLALLERSPDAPGRELVAPFLRERFAERAAARRFSARRVVLTVAAAAAALVAGALWRLWSRQEARQPHDELLSERSPAGLTPSGPVGSFGPFGWNLALPPGGHFELRVWSDEAGASDEPLVILPLIEAQHWEFGEQVTDTWPDHIRWELQVFDATGNRLPGADARAERSR